MTRGEIIRILSEIREEIIDNGEMTAYAKEQPETINIFRIGDLI